VQFFRFAFSAVDAYVSEFSCTSQFENDLGLEPPNAGCMVDFYQATGGKLGRSCNQIPYRSRM
jgi:hypothetical protein